MELCKPIRNQLVSEIERDAKRAVVDAVEARWKRAEALKRRAALRTALREASFVLLLVVTAIGAVLWYLNRGSVRRFVDKARAAVFQRVGQGR